jgi:hypothetical protein
MIVGQHKTLVKPLWMSDMVVLAVMKGRLLFYWVSGMMVVICCKYIDILRVEDLNQLPTFKVMVLIRG